MTTLEITATVASGTITLSGDIDDNVIFVTKGESAEVVIADTTAWYIYAASLSSKGAAGGCWGRMADAAANTFNNVVSDTHNIVYAVSKTNTASVTYGPVITVKPKG